MKKLDPAVIGKKFNRLTVIGIEKNKRGRYAVVCKCDCGTITRSEFWAVNVGSTKSCGCYARDKNTTHNMAKIPEYKIWKSMKSRCDITTGPEYHNYGGRGISYCKEWERFEEFIADMGLRPSPKHQIDRINNDGNYEPSNCRWVTPRENICNRRVTKRYGGYTLRELSELTGVNYNTLCGRAKKGKMLPDSSSRHA